MVLIDRVLTYRLTPCSHTDTPKPHADREIDNRGANTGRGTNNKFTIKQACFCPIYRPQGP